MGGLLGRERRSHRAGAYRNTPLFPLSPQNSDRPLHRRRRQWMGQIEGKIGGRSEKRGGGGEKSLCSSSSSFRSIGGARPICVHLLLTRGENEEAGTAAEKGRDEKVSWQPDNPFSNRESDARLLKNSLRTSTSGFNFWERPFLLLARLGQKKFWRSQMPILCPLPYKRCGEGDSRDSVTIGASKSVFPK